MAELSALDALLGADINVEDTVHMKRLGVDFTVKALTGDRVAQLREQCTYPEGKGGKRKLVVNEEELGNLLIAEGCVNPDFGDKKLLEKYGAKDASECVQKALLAGEVATLSHAVLDVSGFTDDDDKVDEAKN